MTDGNQEITIYLRSASEGTYSFNTSKTSNYAIIYDLYEIPQDFARATVGQDDQVFISVEGKFSFTGISEITGTFNLRAVNGVGEVNVKEGKFTSVPVTTLNVDDCLLTKITKGASYMQFIYNSKQKVILQYVNVATYRRSGNLLTFCYHKGALWPSISTSNVGTQTYKGLVWPCLNYTDWSEPGSPMSNETYEFDGDRRVVKIKSGDCGAGQFCRPFYTTASYSASSNISKISLFYKTGNTGIYQSDLEFLEYDQKKNPYALLSKSMGVPQIFSNNNELSGVGYKLQNIYYGGYKPEIFTYEYVYNGSNYPTRVTSNPGSKITEYEYWGCN